MNHTIISWPWLLLGGLLIVAVAVVVVRVRALNHQRADSSHEDSLVFRLKRSGQIKLPDRLVMPQLNLSLDDRVKDAHTEIHGGAAAVERYADLFRNFDSARLAAEVAALKELLDLGLEQIDLMNSDALGLHAAGLGIFPDPSELQGDRPSPGDQPPIGISTGGLASQDGGRSNPLGRNRDALPTAASYFHDFYESGGTVTHEERTDWGSTHTGYDQHGRVWGETKIDASGRPESTLIREDNHDGSSQTTAVDHQTNGWVQVTKEPNGRVTKAVYNPLVRVSQSAPPPEDTGGEKAGGDLAGNPGDEPTERQHEMGMWLWRQHNLGKARGAGPPTVVYINPPGPGESVNTDAGPYIYDVVELDIVGNPDPNNISNDGRMPPPEYRKRLENFLRDKVGGRVNPPGPGDDPS